MEFCGVSRFHNWVGKMGIWHLGLLVLLVSFMVMFQTLH